MPNSLLLTLLATDDYDQEPLTLVALAKDDPSLHVPEDRTRHVQGNIDTVVSSIKSLDPREMPSLIKDVAQKELYEALYSIIQKEYGEPPKEPLNDQQRRDAELNRTLNSAIGLAIENAISGALKDEDKIQQLRRELRKRIIEAITPK